MESPAICFGEMLWDVLPEGKKPGGAPMNVVFHLRQFGIPVIPISRLGKDALGDELLSFWQSKQVDLSLVQRDPDYPTGTVDVALDKDGHATYQIRKPVAWDFLQVEKVAQALVAASSIFVFGSLAARHEVSRNTLMELLDLAPRAVFDVNLRPPHFDHLTLESLLSKARIIKMNEDELSEISSWYDYHGNPEDLMEQLFARLDAEGLLLTMGKDGAAYFDSSGYYHQEGFPVKVADTVGSGDSFLAGFLSARLKGAPIQQQLATACKVGAFVASRRGATPEYDYKEVLG